MGVGECDGEGVAGVSLQGAVYSQQNTHHVLYLGFVGAAAADDGLFDFFGRVFIHRQVGDDYSANSSATRLAEFQCRIWITRHKNAFDGDFVGFPGVDNLTDILEYLFETQGKIFVVQQFQCGVKDMFPLTAGITVDNANAGALTTGINAENTGHEVNSGQRKCAVIEVLINVWP